MNDQTDQQLLRAYAECQSEAAFAVLVQRYVDLVYSAALRMVCDAHAARDVTQSVFVVLAQNARQLTDRPALAGWLHTTARNLAVKAIRSDVRRRAREQEAAVMNELLSAHPDASWEHIAPHLDEALGELSESDRDAVLLRYFKNHDLRTVGATLGISDDAAQKRVSRAVERLREFFAKRGVTVGASGLAVVISANAVQAAPVGLALTISTAAAALAGATLATTIATQTTMNWINLKSTTVILATAIAAGSGTYLTQKHHATALERANQTLSTEKILLRNERDIALANVEAGKMELERLRENQNDLLRLRAEVAALRRQSAELDQLRETNRRLQAALQDAAKSGAKAEVDSENDPEQQSVYAKLNDAKLLVLGMLMFANDNQDQFPTDLSQTTNYWKNAEHQFTDTNNFELVLRGPLKSVTNPSTVIAVREKDATFLRSKWFKAYGFADGHAELKAEPPEGFIEWERAHIIPSPPAQ